MVFFDIHTHTIIPHIQAGLFEVKRVLNTFPEDFYKLYQSVDVSNWFSCGIHPWYADGKIDNLKLLEEIIQQDRVVAVGEVGLDKLKGPDLRVQVDIFREQIYFANKYKKPLIIHCVKAWAELIALYKELKTDIPWIIHGYRGGVDQTKQLVRLGFKFSVGEKFNSESLTCIPIESLFCETDESTQLINQIYEHVSLNMGLDIEQFAFMLLENIDKYVINMSK